MSPASSRTLARRRITSSLAVLFPLACVYCSSDPATPLLDESQSPDAATADGTARAESSTTADGNATTDQSSPDTAQPEAAGPCGSCAANQVCCTQGPCSGQCVPDCRLGGACPNALVCSASGVCVPGPASDAGVDGPPSDAPPPDAPPPDAPPPDAPPPDAPLDTGVDATLDASSDATSPVDAGSDVSLTPIDGGSCTLQANTYAAGTTSASGCVELVRDTSSCMTTRQNAGLTGFWLRFSCRVNLVVGTDTVTIASDGQPDYRSNYFAAQNACHETYTGATQNPNTIGVKAFSVPVPRTPNTTENGQMGGVMGVALNGVAMFSNNAAPGDDIYLEAQTFDRCGAHPNQTSTYHYHSEPYSISNDDSNFIGVLRDGYPVYGRRDPDNSLPTLDQYGGHTGVTIDSPVTPVYHYHVNLQTSTKATSLGQQQWFIMTGKFRGSTLTCATCNQ